MKLRNNSALFWCGSEQGFLRMKEVMSDPDVWPKTYADFVHMADELVEAAKKKGILLTKIDADPDAFLAWCQVKSCAPDRGARQLYAIEMFSNRRCSTVFKKRKTKKRAPSCNPIEQWCAELNAHFDELEAAALVFITAASRTGQFAGGDLEALLDPGHVLNLIKGKITEIEGWFEQQVNLFIPSDPPITLPTGWLLGQACHHLTLISQDLQGLEDSVRKVAIHVIDSTGPWARTRKFLKGWTSPVEAIREAFFDKSWERAATPLQTAVRRLQRDAKAMRTELAEITANTWNNEIVPVFTAQHHNESDRNASS